MVTSQRWRVSSGYALCILRYYVTNITPLFVLTIYRTFLAGQHILSILNISTVMQPRNQALLWAAGALRMRPDGDAWGGPRALVL